MDQRGRALVPAPRGAGARVRTRLRGLGRGPRRRPALGRRRAAARPRPRQRRGHPVARAAGGRGHPPLRGGVRPPRGGRRRGTGRSRPGGPQPDVFPAESAGVVAGGGRQDRDSGSPGGRGKFRCGGGCWGLGFASALVAVGGFAFGAVGRLAFGFAAGDSGRGAGRLCLAGCRWGRRGAGCPRRAGRGDPVGGDRHQRGSGRGPFGTAARDRVRTAAERAARGRDPGRRRDRADVRRQPTPAHSSRTSAG